ncbi:hypothetical protein [Brachybacterium paraconglomeratum]|uniref:hypothetical protein n=1 Tax=Brachybacterium paraconglomeratum TaxID=173362 RepID=UPI0022AE8A96|nr:hypothetical protein [Brachybacterium paraconglomeratum]MCZ4328079.1 hypothetical protein [Brachybacterium paraconglomeratum]
MTGALLAGLGIGLVGALLLAAGVDLQSRAVQAAHGRSRVWLHDRRWWGGAVLLATAVGTNLGALALAPVSAVQSVNIVALAASTLFAARSGRVVLTRRTLLAVAACIVGVVGFVAVLAAHPAEPSGHDLDPERTAVLTILAGLVLVAVVVTLAGRRTPRVGATGALLGLGTAAMTFASITTVVKAHVDLVLDEGLPTVLADPATLLAVGLLMLAGTLASVLLQRAHRDLAPPTVVAGTTLTDTVTAAMIGILVLEESAPTLLAAMLLLACAVLAVIGVQGLRRALPAAGSDPTRHPPGGTVPQSAPIGRHRSGEGPGGVQDAALVDLRSGAS